MPPTFKTRVFQDKGSWFFRWDNVHVATACRVIEPLGTREDAESEKERFVETERQKRPWVVFETE